MATTGSLSYDFSNKNFLVNRTGTDDGWVSLPISPSAENITQEDLKTWANKLGGQNQSRLYVDIGNPLASDSKNNRGNSQLRPFRSIERALAEVARISFKKNPAGNSTPNDAFERITISIAPGEYEVQNGPRSKLGVFDNYGRYQDAAFLIGERKDTIVDTSFAAITDPSYRISTYEQDLDYFLNAIIKDLSTGGNVYTLRVAQTLVTSDESVGYNGPNDPQSGYFVTRYADGAARTQLVTALNTLAIEAKAAMRDATGYDIILDNASPTCQDVADSIDTLTNIIINTFNCGIDPRDATLIKYGAYSASEFPVSEPSKADLQRFNSIDKAGIILPRGVSIVGEDLRKVVIRPTYVPDPTDPLVGRGAIFRMTGGNFFSGFTIKDQKLKNTANPSHHKLTAFEFCSEEDLESYYTDIDIAFSDPNVYNRALDAANLLEKNEKWIAENFDFPNNDYGLVFESESEQLIIAIQKDLRGITNKNVIEFGKKFHNAHIAPLEVSTQAPARDAYHNLLDDLYSDIVRAISNLGGVVDLEVIDSGTESEVFDGVRAEPFVGRCADIQAVLYTYIEAVKALITDPTASIAEGLSRQAFAFEPSDIEVRDPENSIVLGLSAAEEVNTPGADKINTVLGASPYIFSASIRSEYGMCGIDGDGSKVTGLKSYLAAQFTIVSLQKDPAAFVEDTVEVGGNRYRGSKVTDSVDYTHFGYRVSNGAYSQLVSCFCIGPARHYVAESGGEFSITNSTSNFGDVSLYSLGFNDYVINRPELGSGAYDQDKGHKLIGVIRPKNVDFDSAAEIQNYGIGSVLSYQYTNTVLTNEPDPSAHAGWQDPPAAWLDWTNTYLDTYGDTYYRAEMSEQPILNQEGYPTGEFNIVEVSREYVQGTNPETGQVLTRNVDYPTEFNNIKAVKLRLNGRLSNLPSSIRIKEDGTPDLKYIYAPEVVAINSALNSGPFDVSSISGANLYETGENYKLYKLGESNTTESLTVENKYLVSNWLGASSELLVGTVNNYNSTISTKRRAPVLSVKFVDDGEGGIYTDIIIDVSEGAGTVGEWFERSTVYSPTAAGDYNTIRTSLIGNSIFVKRFIDRRTTEEKKYRLIFKKADSTKRIPPDNYIIRKGGESLSTQPFKLGANTEVLNTLYYTVNPQLITDNFLLELAGGEDGSGAYKSVADLEVNHDPTEADFFFMTELYSANSDGEYRAITSDDISLTDRFYFTEDAETINLLQSDSDIRRYYANRPGYYNGMEISAPADFNNAQYQSAIQLFDRIGGNSVINLLLGVNNISSDLKSNLEVRSDGTTERIYLFGGLTAGLTVEFCKPSTIRASGQTWEYCGYYNYSTGIPALQTENLADRVEPGRKRQFRFEKIQKSIAGGRIYSTGMDELGNVIQGNTIIDLKSGEAETLVLGTTQEVLNLNTDSESNPERTIAQNFNNISTNNITVNSSLKATESAEIDFSKVSSANFKLPGQTNSDDAVITIGQPNLPSVRFITNELDLQEAKNIKSRTFEQTQESDNEYVLQLGVGDNKVQINANNLSSHPGDPSQQSLESQYTLAKKSTDAELTTESSNLTYVTPAQLKTWRRSQGILSSVTKSLSVYVGLGWIPRSSSSYDTVPGKPSGDGPVVTAATLKALREWDITTNDGPGFQCSSRAQPNFRPLRDFAEVAQYMRDESFEAIDVVTIYAAPGIYNLTGITFNSGITLINPNHNARFDGKDHFHNPDRLIAALNGIALASDDPEIRTETLRLNRKNFARLVLGDYLNGTGTNGELTDSDLTTLGVTVSDASDINNTMRSIVRGWDFIVPTIYTNGDHGTTYAGLSGVILAFTKNRYVFRGSTQYDSYFYSTLTNFAGKYNDISNVKVWGPEEYGQQACESIWVERLMANYNGGARNPGEYFKEWDVENNIYALRDMQASDRVTGDPVPPGSKEFDTANNPYCLPYRSIFRLQYYQSVPVEVSGNVLGYNHPGLASNTFPEGYGYLEQLLYFAHNGYKNGQNQQIGYFGNDTKPGIFYNVFDGASNLFAFTFNDPSSPGSVVFRYNIFGAAPNCTLIYFQNFTGSLTLTGNSIRGNSELSCDKLLRIRGLVGNKQYPDYATGGDASVISDIYSANRVPSEYPPDPNNKYGNYASYGQIVYIGENSVITSLNLNSAVASTYYPATDTISYVSDYNSFRFERTCGGGYLYDIELISSETDDILYRGITSIDSNYIPTFKDYKLADYSAGTIPDGDVQVANHLLGQRGNGSDATNPLELKTRGPIISSVLLSGNKTNISLGSYSTYKAGGTRGFAINSYAGADEYAGGLFVENLQDTTQPEADRDLIVGTDLAYMRAGLLYKIENPGDIDFTAVGASDNNQHTIFKATGAPTGIDPTSTSSVRLYGGSPKIYMPYEQPPTVDMIGDKIGQFRPIHYQLDSGFKGSIGSSLVSSTAGADYLVGFPSKTLDYGGSSIGCKLNVGDQYSLFTAFQPSFTPRLNTLSSYRFFTKQVIDRLVTDSRGFFASDYFTIYDVGYLFYLIFNLKIGLITSIFSSGSWSFTQFGSDISTNRGSIISTGYLPYQYLAVDETGLGILPYPLGLTINPNLSSYPTDPVTHDLLFTTPNLVRETELSYNTRFFNIEVERGRDGQDVILQHIRV